MNHDENARYKQAYNLVIKHYWQQLAHNWRTSVPGLLLPAAGSIFVFFIPAWSLSKLIEIGTAPGVKEFTDFIPMLCIFIGSWALGEGMWRLGVHIFIKTEIHAMTELYRKGLSQLLERDLSFFHDNFAGSLTKRTLSYANRFVDVGDTLLYNVTPNIIPAIFALIVLSSYSIWLSLFLIVSIIIAISIIVPLIRKRRTLVTLRETASTIASGHIADVYGNIDAVRAHASEHREQARHMRFVNDLAGKTKQSWDFQNLRVDTIISPLYVFINASGLILALHLAINSTITWAAVIVVFTYYARVTLFMWEFNGIYRRLETAISDAAQYTELLLTEPTILDPERSSKITDSKGEIAIEDVHFRYDKNANKLFDHFSLQVPAGQHVGLVGRSGGGKSSITKLLLRFSDIDEGSIKIDGVDIRDLTQVDLRDQIAYVPQDPVMFHRTIAENIAYGKPQATQEEIEVAAKNAHAHEFISMLPLGYETLVGERGIKLSGGQRQRIAIARAMLKDSPILLLDEATSALDSESEKLIQDALWRLMKGKTAIVIAHRLSTIQKMDRIIVLDKGTIVEEGTHNELLKHKGIYAELWGHQSGGFLED